MDDRIRYFFMLNEEKYEKLKGRLELDIINELT